MKAHTEILNEEQRINFSYASVAKVARYFTLALDWAGYMEEVGNIIMNKNELVM